MTKVRDICEKLRSGEMTLDFAGHCIGIDLDRLMKKYDDQHYEEVVRVTGDESQFNFVHARMDLERK